MRGPAGADVPLVQFGNKAKRSAQEEEGDAEAGATALIQPGGSMNDAAVIEAADKAGLAMVFTGQRHFRH